MVGVIASLCVKSLGVKWLKPVGLRDCVCVYVYGIGCFFFWHINLSRYCVNTWPSVDIERWFVSHSGAGGAGVVFFVALNWNLSEWWSLKLMSSRDLGKVLVQIKIDSSYFRMEYK